jgi:hypothetical protein
MQFTFDSIAKWKPDLLPAYKTNIAKDKTYKANVYIINAFVDSVFPVQNKLNIPLTSNIIAYFNQNMNSSTLDGNNVTFYGSVTGKNQGTITYNSSNYSMQIVPTSPFKYGELINTTLDTGIKTSSGISISPFVWNFTTMTEPSNMIFNQTGTIGVGNFPWEVHSGDFDSDGDIDLVVANSVTNTISVLKNNGAGVFSLSTSVGAGSSPYNFETGDLDGDGDLDLIVSSYGSGSVTILKNDGAGTFTLTSSVGGVSTPQGITIRDFDGDGDLDFAVVKLGSNTVSIFKNDGSGIFILSSNILVGSGPRLTVSGDFDSDGDLDIAVTNAGTNTVSILNNNGTGVFTESTVGAGINPYGITTGDLDNDGDLDLAVTNVNSSSFSILNNNGLGVFILSSSVGVGINPHYITSGDFDGDGDIDLAVTNQLSNIVSITKNNGTGTFSVPTSIGVGSRPFGITTGDFNNDGVLDIATANGSSNNVSILMNLTPPQLLSPSNNSVGNSIALNFSWKKSLGTSNYRLQIATDSSFNNLIVNDSTLLGTDSIKSVSGLSGLTWYYWRMNSKSANGSSLWSDTWKFKTKGTPTQVTLYSPANNSVNQPINISFQWYKAVDQTIKKNSEFKIRNSEFKEKGSPEAISKYWIEYCADSTFATGVVLDSTLTDTTKSVSGLNYTSKYYWRVKAKNELGWSSFSSIWNFTTLVKIDSVSPNQNKLNVSLSSVILAYFNQSMNGPTMNSNNVTFYGSMTGRKQGTITYNSGNYSMQLVPNYPFKFGELITVTLDTGIKSSFGNPISPFVWNFTTLVNPSNKVFNQTDSVVVGYNPYAIESADFDGNGDIDLAVANYSSPTITILLNDGKGKFIISSTIAVGSHPLAITSSDFDGDGDIDLAVSNYLSNSVSILNNNGSGTFSVSSTIALTLASNPVGIESADIDGDGDMDLAIANIFSNTISILNNNGSGTFSQSSLAVGNGPRRITLADFDIDGDMDLAVTNYFENTFSVCKNNGNGSFFISATLNVGEYPSGITSADIDSDGDMDIAVANSNSNSVSVFKNNGEGTFTLSSTPTVENLPEGEISSSDYDGDGDIDIACSNSGSNTVSVLRNDGTGAFPQIISINTGNSPRGVTSADFDGDGDIDLATNNYSSGSVSIIINLSPPQLVNPFDDTTGIPTNYNFTWNKSLGASNYRFQIATDSLFNNIVVNDSSLLGTDSVKSVSGLNPLTWYYWRMNSKSANGISLWSETRRFKILGQPNQVTLAEPLNNSTKQQLDMTFKWHNSSEQTLKNKSELKNINNKYIEKNTPDAISKYWFEYSTDSTFAIKIGQDSTLTDTTKSISGLNYTTKYYWRVKAKNETGWGVFSSIWNFTTLNITDSVSPNQNKLNVPLTSDIKAYFHQSMNSSTLDSNNVTFYGSMTGRKRGMISYNSGNYSMQLVPSDPFKYGELISSTLDTGIKTSSGNSITPFVWNFTSITNPANAIFVQTSNMTVGSNPEEITSADFDGDGDIDLAITNNLSNDISILKNNGNGIFTLTSNVSVGTAPKGIVSADLDGDGDIDLAVTNNSSNSVSILKNGGNATFTVSSTIAIGTDLVGITASDLDGDGNIDLAVATFNSGNVKILMNDGNGSFMVSSTITIPSGNPYGITSADVDGDGDIDLAITNLYTSSVSILKNNGNGIFTVNSTINGIENWPNGITASDLDGDGDIDLGVARQYSSFVDILKNDGSGTFTVSSTLTIGSTPRGITSADLDGDGDIDLAVNTWFSGAIYILKNSGNGLFTQSLELSIGTTLTGITSADFDGDGDIDLASTNLSSNNVRIVINISPPSLISPANNTIGQSPSLNFVWNKSLGASNYRIQIASDSLFNNLIVNDSALLSTDSVKSVSGLNSLTWYYWRMNSKCSSGSSLWSNTWKFKTQGTATQVILYAPVNNSVDQPVNITFQWYKAADQTLKIQNSNLKVNNVSEKNRNIKSIKGDSPDAVSKYWLEYSTDSTFAAGVILDSILTDTTKSVSGLNHSSKYYWRVKAKNETGWSIFSSVWNFSTIVRIDSVSPNQNKLNVPLTSDIKAYFRLNMNSSTFNNNSVTFFGSMTGRKQGTITYNSGNNSMQLVPNNPFKYGELINTTLDSGIKTSLGNSIIPFVWNFTTMAEPSNMIFNQIGTIGVGNFPWEVHSGDFDSDGDIDLVVANSVTNTISVLKNNGAGVFSLSTSVGAGSSPYNFETGDLDGDGDLDLIVSSYGSGSVTILKNDGAGTFTLTSSVGGVSTPQGITIRDFDGDGDLDFAVVKLGSNTVSIFKNDGSGIFILSSNILVGSGPRLTVSGDFDSDGDLDIAVTNAGTNTVSILNNNGTGVFTESTVGAGINPYGITTGDLDNDGDLDLAVTNVNSSSFSILNNNGLGVFILSSSVGVGINPHYITSGDFDGDGDIDLAVTNQLSNIVSITKNNGTGTFSVPTSIGVGSRPFGITTGDFNNDGVLDIATANGSSNNVSILMNLTPPQLLSPSNNSVGNSIALNFSWKKSLGTSNYRIQIATDSLFNNLIVNDSTLLGTDSIKSVSGLSGLTWYYWRMNSKSAIGSSLWSDTWKFKTLGKPNQITLIEPVNDTINQPIDINFKWSKAYDQTEYVKSKNKKLKSELKDSRPINNLQSPYIHYSPDSEFNYWLEYSIDSTFATGVVIDSTLTDTTKTVSGLTALTKYFWRVKAKNLTGWSEFSLVYKFTTLQNLPINLNICLEGFWNGTSHVSDTLKLYLANPIAPYSFVDSTLAILSTSGATSMAFTKVRNGNYYLVITHRNHLETWSKTPFALATNITLNYDFTTSISQAYGDNLVLKDGKYCLYAGDVNHDGFIEIADLDSIFVDNINGVEGWVVTDLTGDLFTEIADLDLVFINNIAGIYKQVPEGADCMLKSDKNKMDLFRNKLIKYNNEQLNKKFEKIIEKNKKVNKVIKSK